MIENGTKIKWETGTLYGRLLKVKEGTVLAFIPAGEIPSKVYPELNDVPKNRDKLGYGFHGASSRDRSLVRVDRFHAKTGEPIAPWWYAPTKKSIDAKNSG